MRKVENWLASAWYPVVLTLAVILAAGLLLWFQLDSLTPGYSQPEVRQDAAVTSLRAIRDNPLNLPHKLLHYGFTKIDGLLPSAGRSASAVAGLVLLGSFFFILRQWYTRRVAVLGTILFGCSAWFLHTARTGTDSSMYAMLLLAVACAAWLQQKRSGSPAILISALVLAALLYIPGMIWFVVPVVIWQLGRISRLLHQQKLVVWIFMIFASLALITPLVWAFYSSPELIKTYLGLPQDFLGPLEIIKNIARVPMQLFFRGPNEPAFWLGRLPLLDWFSMAMFVIGAYAYYHKRGLDRTRFIAYVFVVGTILVGLGGPVTINILLPFVYLFVAGGIALMLQQWFTVFPRNPLARTTGSVLMSLAVLMSVFYNINHYFIAWPNTPETKKVFVQSEQ